MFKRSQYTVFVKPSKYEAENSMSIQDREFNKYMYVPLG